MENIYIVATTLYICMNVVALAGLVKIAFESSTEAYFPAKGHEQKSVSVVVAARNEAGHLPSLLTALLGQRHTALEIIIVSDRSTDATDSLVSSVHDPRVRLIRIDQLPEGLAPKKYALGRGIRASQGEIIFLTDADCTPPPEWISETLKCFDEQTGAVIGYSPYRGALQLRREPLLSLFQRYECLRTAMLAAGAAGRGAPYMATGRNFAYRRSAFEAVQGFDRIKHLASGDDDLLLQQLVKRTKWRVKYFVASKTFVETDAQPTWTALFNQKSRHTSAAINYRWPVLLFLFLYHISNFAAMLLLLPVYPFLSYLLLRHGFQTFHAQEFERKVFYLEPLYTLYAMLVPLLALRKFSWKP
ncbi:MAG: glycosyltransferase [Rhizobacter sp.]|nr:glycosyltransferase [Chlorobiales bacterium]